MISILILQSSGLTTITFFCLFQFRNVFVILPELVVTTVPSLSVYRDAHPSWAPGGRITGIFFEPESTKKMKVIACERKKRNEYYGREKKRREETF